MNPMGVDERLEALTGYLKRPGGQSIVPGTSKWRSYRVCELVEAVEVARQRIRRMDTSSTEQQGHGNDTEQPWASAQFPVHKKGVS